MTRARNILRALNTGPKTTGELCQPDVGGVRFGARIEELRASGYIIHAERLTQSSHLYTLAGRPGPSRGVALRCGYGHEWDGHARRSAQGYPLLDGAGPVCPMCGRTPCAVEGAITPAHPDVIAKAAA